VLFDRPVTPDGTGLCMAFVTSATMSTCDKRVGTGPEINGKLYELFEDL
jgi:hypothetical protein